MKLIFGLGNPGTKYAATRHNIGFDTVTALSDAYDIRLTAKENKGICGKGQIHGEKVILIQPQTFMNLSGECVRAFMDFYKVGSEDVLIIYDDINLEPGRLRIRERGSAGGHNGMKSIIQHMGTQEFDRIRIGVGEKPEGWDLADYVTGRFDKSVEPIMREAIANAVKVVELIIAEGCEAAMNHYNR